jgi:hypothetical protein
MAPGIRFTTGRKGVFASAVASTASMIRGLVVCTVRPFHVRSTPPAAAGGHDSDRRPVRLAAAPAAMVHDRVEGEPPLAAHREREGFEGLLEPVGQRRLRHVSSMRRIHPDGAATRRLRGHQCCPAQLEASLG